MRTTTDGGGNGVTKKKSKKQLSRQQKERKAKALERAEAATEKLAAKREDSFVRARVAQSRRVCMGGEGAGETNVSETDHGRQGNWEVLNEKMQEDLEEALVLATVQKPIENVK